MIRPCRTFLLTKNLNTQWMERPIYILIFQVFTKKANPFSIFVSGLNSSKIFHGAMEFGDSPPLRPSIELDLFETFLHHGGQRIRSFLGITQQHLRVLLDFFFGCFLEPNKNAFFRNGDICCWLLAGLCFWRFKKGVKESKYNSPTDEFDLVIVEILNDATNMLWR